MNSTAAGEARTDPPETADAPPPPRSPGELIGLFVAGLLGGMVTIGAVLPALTVTHCGCGATPAAEQARQTRKRCLELGVTPEELAALDAAAAARAAGGE